MEIRCGIEKLGVACFLPREGIGSRLLAAQVVSDQRPFLDYQRTTTAP
jgi:hypothetical protein